MSLYEHPKIRIMPSGWYVVLETGEVFTEHDGINWSDILTKAQPTNYKQGIDRVGLKNRNKRIEIQGKQNYTRPGVRHMREIRVSGLTQTIRSCLVERYISYYDTKAKVITRVDIKSGKYRNVIEPY